MTGTMSRESLCAELKDSLHDAAQVLSGPLVFDRFLDAAVSHLGELAPRTLVGSLNLIAGVSEYEAPADYWRFKMALWGTSTVAKPWDKAHPGRLPDVYHIDGLLVLAPSPTLHQISVLGSDYRFFYFAKYILSESAELTTVPPALRDTLLLRAQAECCKELALRNFSKPVSLGGSVAGSITRNGTPSALYGFLMDEFKKRVVG